MEKGKQDNKPVVRLVATQKTFRFAKHIEPEKIDEQVNPWLLEMVEKETPAMLGKTFGMDGHIYYVFLYSRKVEEKK